MIELIAEGPIRRTTRKRIIRDDGSDGIVGSVCISRTETARVDLEFPQGHVNIEGYAVSSHWVDTQLGSVEHHLDLDRDDEIVTDEWDVRLEGEWWDWIQAAHHYQTERPDCSIVDVLEIFSRWDETRTETLERAIEEVVAATKLADTPSKEFGADGWQVLTDSLNSIDRVNIPESYTE